MGKEYKNAKKKIVDARKEYKKQVKEINAEFEKKSNSLRSKKLKRESEDKVDRVAILKSNVELVNERTLYRHPKKKRAIVFAAGAAIAAVTAGIAVGVSTREYDYKPNILFNLGQRDALNYKGTLNKDLRDFTFDNKVLVGNAVKTISDKVTNWDPSEKLVKVGSDPVKKALSKGNGISVYYFAKTKPKTAPPAPAPRATLGQAFDDPSDSTGPVTFKTSITDEYDVKNPVNPNELTTPSLKNDPTNPNYKGYIPEDYDSANRRYGSTVVANAIGDYEQVGEYTHKVYLNEATGEITSIEEADGNTISGSAIKKLDLVLSKEIDVVDEKGTISKERISYKEALDKMEVLVKQLGDIRGVSSKKIDFENNIHGKNLDIYSTNIAGIFDIPSYIHLLVDKEQGSSKVNYRLSFDQSVLPGLDETASFTHEIVLFQQPGGAIQVLDNAVKDLQKAVTKTFNGEYDGVELKSTGGYKFIDLTNQDSDPETISLVDFEKLTGLKINDYNWVKWLRMLPSMKLQYQIETPLREDGTTNIKLRTNFKTYFSNKDSGDISINVKGITQAIVNKEQERINAKKETFDLKVDEIKLAVQKGKELTDDLITYYGLEGLIDPQFTYKISHPEVNSDGTVKMKLEVSKDGIKSNIASSEIDLDVRGIDNAKELAAEQTYFNTLKPTLQVSDVEYPEAKDKVLSQADIDALGLSHKLNLSKYEYHLTNTKVTASGTHPMTISVTPLANQGIHVHPTPFQMNFKGISEAKEVAQEQARVNALTSIKAKIDEVNLPEAKDAPLTPDVAKKLGLTSAIKTGFTYTYTHQGINSDTTLDVYIQVAKTGTTYKATPTPIKDVITGIDRAIAIAGQAKEQEEINKLASQTYTRKVDALSDPANVNKELKDGDFAKLGLAYKVKPGYIYHLNSLELNTDKVNDYKITVMVLKGTSADTEIGPSKTVLPAAIHFNVSGIKAAKDLKDEQTRVNALMAKTPTATLTAKDLKYATIKDTLPVEFEKYEGPLTQLISNTLNLGIDLDPKFSYNIKYAKATKDVSSFDVTITVSLPGTTNFVLNDNPSSITNPIHLTGITAVSDALGLDKEQTIVNALAGNLIELNVSADSYASADKKALSAEIMAALVKAGYKDESAKYDYVITNPEMKSDGEMQCSILLHVKGQTVDPTIAPVPVAITVRGIEDYKMAEEQTRVNGASATYEVPDADLEGLDITTIETSTLKFAGVTDEPLTTEIIDKYGIKIGGSSLVMSPQYKYTYSFDDIDSNGDKALKIKVTGLSTFDSKPLTQSTATSSTFKITGFDRALKEKNLAIEQKRLNNLPVFASPTIVREIQLGAGRGELTDKVKAKLFSMVDPSDATKVKTKVDPDKISHLGLDDTLYTYTYSNPKINSDGKLEITIIASAKDAVKQLVNPSPFKIDVEGINAAVIQYINDIIIGTMSSKVVETSIDECSFAGIDASAKADPTEAALKLLSLSFDKTTLNNMLNGLTGVDAGILKTATDAIAAAGQVVGLSTWLENAKKQAIQDGNSIFNAFYEIHPCDDSGNVIAGAKGLDADGYMMFTLHFNVDGQSPVEKSAKIHITGITTENRRVALAKEQSRINALAGQSVDVAETSLDLITKASKTELTDELVSDYGLKGADGKALVLDKTMTYYIWTDSDDHNKLIKNGDLHVSIQVLDKIDPNLEVHDVNKGKVVPASFIDHIGGISEQRAIVTQTDAQNEINALAAGHYNMLVDKLDLPKIGTAVQLKTIDDFKNYGIDFDPTATSKSESLGIDFPRDGYHYELTTDKDLDADGELVLTITAVIDRSGVKTLPTVTPVAIKTQVVGIDAAKALKTEQERVNTEAAADKATFNWDHAEYASVDKQPLTQAILKELGLSLTLNGAYVYTYSIPKTQTASGDMDVEIFVNATGKTKYGTAEVFKVNVTGIDEYKVLQQAIADIQKEADLSKTTPITYGVDALQIDKVDSEELTQELVTKYGLNINLDPTKFTYTYSITNDVTSDTGFTIDVHISNAGPIKSSGEASVSFNMVADGIDSAKLVHADLGTIQDTDVDLKVTQPVAGTVSDGYNTNEYTAGDVLTEDQIVALTKDSLSTINGVKDVTVFSHANTSGAAWTYTVLSKTGSTLTIEVSATKGNYTEVKNIILNGFINGTEANNFDYPTEEITKDLATLAGTTHTTAVTLPVSAHTDEPLTQQWIDYLDLGIVLDSRFDYTFSNALTASGDMDVTVKVVRKVDPDPALVISQVIKVGVTPPTSSFDKVFTVNSYTHGELTDSNILSGLPFDVIRYVDGITDQFRGFSATYTMAKIDHATNAIVPLTITLKSLDDPSNVYTFKIYMIVGDSSLATGEAKTLLDGKEFVDETTVIPTVISEPTRVPADVLKLVTDKLKAIGSVDAKVAASKFRAIPDGTPLSESLLDELSIDTHIGSAIGLIGDEFTVSSNRELTTDGDIVLTITPVDGSGTFNITVHVTGIDSYKTIKADLDGLSQIYAVEPRNGNSWTTNEYTPWTTKVTEDLLQRLTAHNEWTQGALDEKKPEVIRKIDSSMGIVRTVVLKSKTDEKLVFEITDSLNGVSYSKEVTVNGFVAGTESSNNLEYLHERISGEFDDLKKAPIKFDDLNGEGIPKVTDAVLTQDVKDFYGITLPDYKGAKYIYSTDKGLSTDGSLTLTIKAIFANKEISTDINVDVVFHTQHVFVNFGDIVEGAYQPTDLSYGQLEALKDSLGDDIDKDAYTFDDITLTKTANGVGTISFDLVSINNGAKRTLTGIYLTGFTDKTIRVDNPDKRKLFLEEGQSVSYTDLNKLMEAKDQLPDLPAGFNYEITESRNAGGKAVMHVQILRDIEIIKDFNITLTGIEVLNDQDGLFAENDKGEFGKIGVQKPLDNPLFDSAHNLINDFGPFKAGQSEQFVKDNTFVLELKAHGQEKRIMMMGYLEGTDKGVLSKAIGTILGDNDGTVYLEWNFLPMAGQKSINVGAFKGGMTSSRKEQLQTASFSQVHAMDFHGDFPNGGSYSIKTYGWDDKDNGPEAALDGLINIDTTSKMLPGNTWTTADGFPASDRDLFRTMQTNFNFKKQVATSPTELKTKLGTNFETTIGSTKIVYLKPELYTNDGSSKPFEPGFTDYPSLTTREILEEAGKSTKNINLFVSKELTKDKASGTKAPDWLLKQLGIVLKPGESLSYTADAITNDGIKVLDFELTDSEGVEKTSITLNINGFEEYNKTLETIENDLSDFAGQYDIKPNTGKSWTTTQYHADLSLSNEEVAALTGLENWELDDKSRATGKSIGLPKDGIVRKYRVISKTDTSLNIEVTDSKDGIEKTRTFELKGFVVDPTITMNDIAYNHASVVNVLEKHDGSIVLISDADKDGIPQITNHLLTQEILDFYGIDITLKDGFTWLYSTDKDLSGDGRVALTIKAIALGGSAQSTIDIDVKYIPLSMNIPLPSIADGTYNTATIPANVLKVLKAKLGETIVSDKYTFDDLAITNEAGGKGTFTVELIDKATDAKRDVTGTFFNVDSTKTITVPDAAKTRIYNNGDSLAIWQINKYLPVDEQLVEILPTGLAYKTEMSSNSDGDVVITVKIVDKDNELTQSIYTFKDVKFVTKADLGQAAVQPGAPEFDSSGKLKVPFGPFKAGQSEQFVKDNTFVIDLKAHGLEKRVLMMGYLEGTDKGVLSKALGTILGDNDGTIYVEWNFLPMAGHKSINVGAFKGGMTSSRKEQLQTASFSQLHALDFHGDFPNGGTYSIKTYTWDDKVNGPQAILDGSLTADSFAQMQPGNTWTSHDGITDVDKATLQKLADGFIKKLTPAQLANFRASAKMTWNGQELIYPKQVLAIPTELNPILSSTYEEYPKYENDKVLEMEQKMKSGFPVNLRVEESVVAKVATDQPIPDWLKNIIYVSPQGGETISYTAPAITGNGNVDISVTLKEADGTETTYAITLSVHGFVEYNKALKELKGDIGKLGSSYGIKPRASHSWTTNQYKAGDILSDDELQRLTAVNEWTQSAIDEKSTEVIRPTDKNYNRVIKVKTVNGDSLVLEITEKMNGAEVSKEVTLTGFTVDASVSTPNDLEYLHEIVSDELIGLQDHVELSDLDGMGIPAATQATLSKDIMDYLGLSFMKHPGVEYAYTSSKEISSDGKGEITLEAIFPGGIVRKNISLEVTFKEPDFILSIDGLSDGSYDQKDLTSAQLDAFRKLFPTKMDMSEYSFKDIEVKDDGFTFKLRNDISGAEREFVKGIIVPASVRRSIDVVNPESKIVYYTPGHNLDVDSINEILPQQFKLKDLPAPYSYSITADKNIAGDAVITIKVVLGTANVAEYVYTLTGMELSDKSASSGGVYFLTSSTNAQSPSVGYPEFNSAGKLISDWLGFKAGQTKDDIKRNVQVMNLYMSYGAHWQLVIGDVKNTAPGETVELSPKGKDTYKLKLSSGGIQSWVEGKDYAHYNSWSDIPTSITVLDSSHSHGKIMRQGWAQPGPFRTPDKVFKDPTGSSNKVEQVSWLDSTGKWHTEVGAWSDQLKQISQIYQMLFAPSNPGLPKTVTLGAMIAKATAGTDVTVDGKKIIILGESSTTAAAGAVNELTDKFKEYPLPSMEEILEKYQNNKNTDIILHVSSTLTDKAKTNVPAPQWLKTALGLKESSGETVTCSIPAITKNDNVELSFELTTKDGSKHQYKFMLNIKDFEEYNLLIKDLVSDLNTLSDTYTVKQRNSGGWSTAEYSVNDILSADVLKRLTASTKDEADPKNGIVESDHKYKRVAKVLSKTDDTLTVEITESLNGQSSVKTVNLDGFVVPTGTPKPNNINWPYENTLDEMNALQDVRLDSFDGMGLPKVDDQPLTQGLLDMLGIKLKLNNVMKFTYSIGGELSSDGVTDFTINATLDGKTTTKTIKVNITFKDVKPYFAGLDIADGSYQAVDLTADQLKVLRDGLTFTSSPEDYTFKDIKVSGNRINLTVVNSKTGASRVFKAGYIILEPKSHSVSIPDATNKLIYYVPNAAIDFEKINLLLPTNEKLQPLYQLPSTYSRKVVVGKNSGGDATMTVKILDGSKEIYDYTITLQGLKAVATDDAEKTTFLYFRSKNTVKTASYSIGFPVFDSSGKLVSDWLSFKAGVTKDYIKSNVQLLNLYMSYGAHWQIVVGDLKNMPDGESQVLTPKGKSTYKLTLSKNGIQTWVEGKDYAHYNSLTDVPTGITVLDSSQSHGKIMRQGWAQPGPFRTPDKVFKDPTSSSNKVEQVSWLDSAGKWHLETGAPDTWSTELKEIIEIYRKLFESSLAAQNHSEGWDELYANIKAGSSVTIDGKKAYVFGDSKSDASLSTEALLLPTFNEFPASPAPSADEPLIDSVDTITIDVKEPASPAPAADEVADKPTQIVVPQDDYPVDSPDTSFFAWSPDHIYKGGE